MVFGKARACLVISLHRTVTFCTKADAPHLAVLEGLVDPPQLPVRLHQVHRRHPLELGRRITDVEALRELHGPQMQAQPLLVVLQGTKQFPQAGTHLEFQGLLAVMFGHFHGVFIVLQGLGVVAESKVGISLAEVDVAVDPRVLGYVLQGVSRIGHGLMVLAQFFITPRKIHIGLSLHLCILRFVGDINLLDCKGQGVPVLPQVHVGRSEITQRSEPVTVTLQFTKRFLPFTHRFLRLLQIVQAKSILNLLPRHDLPHRCVQPR